MGTFAVVPVGYMVSVALFATCTLVALVPMRRPRVLAEVSFGLGLTINELPLLAIYFLVADTLLAFGEGDIDSVGGWLAVGVATLTTIGLGVIAARALTARGTIEAALGAALGDDWRDSIDPTLCGRSRRPTARILFAPMAFRRRDVERIKNITYGPAGTSNLLDVYRNRSCPPGAPMLVHFHGGHFRWGKKSREARPLFARLASRGWVCVSANYRLGRTATFPDHLIDAKRVIAWVRSRDADHGGDPTTIFISGSSAGGHLAAMAALTPNDAKFQPGFEPADTSVIAAIAMYGYYGPLDTTDGRPSSPIDYAGPDRPPFFVVHGDHDTVVPVEQARAFVDGLGRTAAKPVVYAELRGAQHSFDVFHSIRFETVIDEIESFAAWVRSNRSAPTTGSSPCPR
jgi:acetyl esterase/lipase